MIERPFLVTLFITLSKVSSRITRSNSCGDGPILANQIRHFHCQLRVVKRNSDIWKISDQKTVEELVHKEAENTDDGVTQVVDEEHVHHNGLVAPSERPLVAHETHEED